MSPLESMLFDGVEVGYRKDIVAWRDRKTLKAGVLDRLGLLQAPARRLNTTPQAQEYFQLAAQRKESVFLSYSARIRISR